ncbi:hypothetical protein Q4I28_007265 [Leishmania naiffi]|uniref:Uncharacterized protein n=1 Tax=Leishmania naiffi TaxID=5678 RepID=A0AAW3B838_9TRYP
MLYRNSGPFEGCTDPLQRLCQLFYWPPRYMVEGWICGAEDRSHLVVPRAVPATLSRRICASDAPCTVRFAHLHFGAFSRKVRICQSDASGPNLTSPWTKDGDKRKMAHRHAQ